jgi:hypothetical protein
MNEMNDHLSRIQTMWSKLLGPEVTGQADARQQELLLIRHNEGNLARNLAKSLKIAERKRRRSLGTMKSSR